MVGIMTEETNPKIVYARLTTPFAAGFNNYIMFSPSSDGGTGYAGRNDIYILGVAFMDADGNFVPLNRDGGPDFPADYDDWREPAVTYEVEIPLDTLEGGQWFYINHIMGFTLEQWNRALAIVVEYDPFEEDVNFEANPFVVQVSDGEARTSQWATFDDRHMLVDVEPHRIIMNLEEMYKVTAVEHIGYGVWNGADNVTRIYVVFEEDN
jgi:hypothetical protein